MNTNDLKYPKFVSRHLKPYAGRAADHSGQFILWFLENVFRLDEQDALDAIVDDPMDKGIDAIFYDDAIETIFVFQSKLNSKDKGKIPEGEVKDFYASLQQFQSPAGVEKLLEGNANLRLKNLLTRDKIAEKIQSGFAVQGIFCSNVEISKDAASFLQNVEGLEVYDSHKICEKYVDVQYEGGIKEVFRFDSSGTDVIKYAPGGGVVSYIFLARALQLVHLAGISDGSLFERNVRLSLGNTKVNKGLVRSIESKKEHKHFPLFHNGITIVCDSVEESAESIEIKNYTVVNGAQSLTSLFRGKSKLTDDLKIVVKVVAIQHDVALADKITNHSNNQNAIKARDLRSNHGIQQRLKSEIEVAAGGIYSYEVKRGELAKDRIVIVNEDVGLDILAMDLAQPYTCHQKYKIMDELHADIFGRPSLDGRRAICLFELGKISKEATSEIDDKPFANYTLTKFFVGHLAWSILNRDDTGSKVLKRISELYEIGMFDEFMEDFKVLAHTVALDLNAANEAAVNDEKVFNYKTLMKSASWCNEITTEVVTSYKKSVLRKQATAVSKICAPYLAALN